jgi:uncharacterized protein YggT (Ycf19 family)
MSEETIPFLTHWYFHLPNYVLAAVMYSLIGRFVLGLFVPAAWDNYIWRALVRITDPVARVVRFLTPLSLPDPVVLLFGAIWLMLARLGFFLLMVAAGLAPTLQTQG